MSRAKTGEGRAPVTDPLEITLAPEISAVEQSRDALIAWLDPLALDLHLTNRLEVVLEELVSNIARHGAPVSFIRVTASHDEGEVTLIVEDDGPAFDPLQRADPERPQSLATAQVGGLGLPLIKRLSRQVDYRRVDGVNLVEAVLGPY